MPDPALVLEGAAKTLLYLSVLLAIGAGTVHWLLLPRSSRELDDHRFAALDSSAARLGFLGACLASVCTLLRVWTHTVAAFGFDGARSWDSLTLVALRSHWGQNWKVQFVASIVSIVAAAATLRNRKFWPLATLSTAAFTSSIPLLGHAAGNAPRMALHIVHILAGGIWLGSLAVIVLISIRTPRQVRFVILRRFSAVALPGAAMVVAAGLIAAWLYVGNFASLWLTGYGRVLMLKVGLVGCIAACGYINWQRLRKPGDEGGSSFLRIEVALAVAVAIVSGYLTEIAHP